MKTLNQIGLVKEEAIKIAELLNGLLANVQIHYQNLRSIHWNVKGKQFFVLHEKVEEFYTNVNENADEIAERILTLGETPIHTFSEYIVKSEIGELKNVSEADASVEYVIGALQTLLKKEREVLSIASEAGDEGTVALMSDFINEQEKTLWMLHAWSGK